MRLIFITHPEVAVAPDRPVTLWGLNETGRARMAAFAASATVADVRHIVASGETKAQEAAAILAASLGLAVRTEPDLGENDRSATGFLPPETFEKAADAFFASPGESFRGWERAVDAQARIVAAVRRICDARRHTDHAGDLAIVSHGAVGTLLWCALGGLPISRRHDQPSQGHYWRADLPGLEPRHGWRPIAPAA